MHPFVPPSVDSMTYMYVHNWFTIVKIKDSPSLCNIYV